MASRTGLFTVRAAIADVPPHWDEVVLLAVTGSGEVLALLVEYKTRLHPQDAVGLARRLQQETPVEQLGVVAAPHISERTATICREEGLGYIDAAGNCHIAGAGLYVHVEGCRNERPDTRPAENIFAPRSSRVVRVLLERPERVWRVVDLARTAHVSLGLASRVRRKLVAEAFVEESSEGIRVRGALELLKAWSSAYESAARPVAVYSMEGAESLERRVAHWCDMNNVQYALAEFSAAARWAPMVRYKRAAIYIAESRSRDVIGTLMPELELKQVDSGASGVLWMTSDDATFFNAEERDGLRVVSPVQTYLDLLKNPARGAEAADEILRREILPRAHRDGAPSS